MFVAELCYLYSYSNRVVASPTYEFFVNAISVQGPSATNTYNYTPANGDVVTVVIDLSSTCAIGNPATQNEVVTMTVYTTPAAQP